MKPLPQSFFAENTVDVAQELLSKIISVNGMQARIVETEAYGRDPASHAFKETAYRLTTAWHNLFWVGR